jgi:hypothetical protein
MGETLTTTVKVDISGVVEEVQDARGEVARAV